MKHLHPRHMLTTGTDAPMVAMPPESLAIREAGIALTAWLRNRGCHPAVIERIEARRFRYGSYRPSDRAAELVPVEVSATAHLS
jgi:hypothetical protein